MRGGVLPAALLCTALGLALAFAPRRALLPALALLAVAALGAASVPLTQSREIAFTGCWASIVILALAVHLPRGLPTGPALVFAINSGFWAGSVIGWEAARGDLLRAIPLALLCLPARLIVQRGWQIGIKIVSSWLIAIAILSALLPATGTPGYVPDHME